MQRWEFAYVNLWSEIKETGPKFHPAGQRAVSAAQEAVARYGQEGWEPVGEVTFRYGNTTTVSIHQLMLKRPLDR